jgi:hypothetical protein
MSVGMDIDTLIKLIIVCLHLENIGMPNDAYVGNDKSFYFIWLNKLKWFDC